MNIVLIQSINIAHKHFSSQLLLLPAFSFALRFNEWTINPLKFHIHLLELFKKPSMHLRK